MGNTTPTSNCLKGDEKIARRLTIEGDNINNEHNQLYNIEKHLGEIRTDIKSILNEFR